MKQSAVLVIGDYLVDFNSEKIQIMGQWQSVSPELMKILFKLTESAGLPVSKAELVELLGEQRKNAPHNVPGKIMKLRQILRDNARTSKYIKSEPGGCYRLVAVVAELHE